MSGRLAAAALAVGLASGCTAFDGADRAQEPSGPTTSGCPDVAAVVVAGGPHPKAAVTGPARRSTFDAAREASFTTGFSDWDLCGPSVLPEDGAVVQRVESGYDGTPAARATVPQGEGNKYARTLWGGSLGDPGALSFSEGTDFTYGTALLLPNGFYDAMQDYFVPLRWDNFGAEQVSRSGLALYEDGQMRLFRERDGVEDQVNLLGARTVRLDEGVWHWLEVRQVLSSEDGAARNELYVDGALVGSSRTRNYYGEPVSAVRFGVVAVDGATQVQELSVLYDRAVLGRGYLGPLR